MFGRKKLEFFYACLSIVMVFCVVIGFVSFTAPRALAAGSEVLTVPEGTNTLFKDSFSGSENVSKIVLPSDFRSISGASKLGELFPNLKEIEVSAENTEFASFDGMLCRKNGSGLVVAECPPQKESVNLDNTITGVSDDAFSNCEKIKDISAGNSEIFRVKNGVLYSGGSIILAEKDIASFAPGNEKPVTVNEYAFAYCTGLKSVTIPDSVKSIKNYAFYCCTSLTAISIPAGVTSIGGKAFCSCSDLKKITLPEGVEYIGTKAFEDTYYYNTTSNWKNNVLYIGTYLIKADSESLSGEYSIKDGTSTIAAGAFSDCKYLTGVNIPDSVMNINSSAFKNCENLRTIRLSKNLRNLASDAFSGCRSVTGFSGDCTNFVIKDGVVYNEEKTEILAFPLARWWENDTFEIPSTVKQFNSNAFKYSFNVKSLTYSGKGFYVDGYGAVYETDDTGGYTLKYIPSIDDDYSAMPETKTIDCSFTGSKIEFTADFAAQMAYVGSNYYQYIYDIDELPDGSFYETTKFIYAGRDVEKIKSSDIAVIVYSGTKDEAGEKFGYFSSQADKNNGVYSAKTLIICDPDGEGIDRLVKSKDGKFKNRMDLERPYSGGMVKDAIVVETETVINYELSVSPLTLNEKNNVRMDGYAEFAFMDITLKRDGVPISPQNPVEIYFKKEYIGYDTEKLFIVHCKRDGTKETFTWNSSNYKYKIRSVTNEYGDYWMITVDSLSPFSIYKTPEAEIWNYRETLPVDYKSKLTFNAYMGAPSGSKIVWNVNGVETEGQTLVIEQATEEEYRISVSIVNENDGEVISASEEEIVTVNTGFFARVTAFFRGIFRILPEYVDNVKVVKYSGLSKLFWFLNRLNIFNR